MDKAALQTELNDLYAARTAVLTGQQLEAGGSGGSDGRRFQFAKIPLNELEALIRKREGQLGIGQRRRAYGVSY